MNKYAISCDSVEDEQLLKDWIKKEFNSTAYDVMDFYNRWMFGFPNFADYNGFNGKNHLLSEWELSYRKYTKINIKDFLKEYNKNMKTELLGLPVIRGEQHHLHAFIKDCEKFGYETIIGQTPFSVISHNRIGLKEILSNQETFTTLYLGSCTYQKSDTKEFQLPQDWSIALTFMEENMKLWNKIQKENKKSEFKVGDIVVCLDTQKTRNGNKDEMYKIIALSSEKDWVYIDVSSTIDVSRLRLATPQEIEEYNNKPKIFKMTSSSGDFELEVSKKGIYYKPEQKWLSTDFLWEFTNKGCKLPHQSGGYYVEVTKVDVGCKKDTLVSEWQEVYNYYKSLQ